MVLSLSLSQVSSTVSNRPAGQSRVRPAMGGSLGHFEHDVHSAVTRAICQCPSMHGDAWHG